MQNQRIYKIVQLARNRGWGVPKIPAKLRSYVAFWGPSLLLLPFAALLRMALLGLRPLVHIRFGQLASSRLGTFTMYTELYLCERDARIKPSRSLDLWYHHDRDGNMLTKLLQPREAIANQQLARMWERVIHVSEVARHLDKLNRLFPPGRDTFVVQNNHRDGNDSNGLLSTFPPHLSFTSSEEEQGQNELRRMGIGPDDRFICFHARDSAYLDTARPRNVEAFGDWRWQDLRDADIQNFCSAAEKLTDLGYFAIRMGKYVKEALTSANPRIIDYATQYRSDFMDIYLSAHCAFFIGSNSGMTSLPLLFRMPVVIVNLYPLWEVRSCQISRVIMLPKKYYSDEWGRCLTFREIMDLGIFHTNINLPEHQKLFRELGIKMVENTPEEIWEAALEMHNRLNSDFIVSKEDQQLQNQFLSVMRYHPDGIPQESQAPDPIAGAHFLRTNQELLA